MPSWFCTLFVGEEENSFYDKSVQNCGLCVHYDYQCSRCRHHDRLKGLSEENYSGSDDFGFSRVNTEWDEGGGYGNNN